MNSEQIRVLLVDDHQLLRQGINNLLRYDQQIKVVGEAADGVEAICKVRQFQPDVILMDLNMPRKSGVDAITEIVQENPKSKILVLTGFADDEEVLAAIRAGAIGYLLKDTPSEELRQAIRAVYDGQSSLHPSIAHKLIEEFRRPPDPPIKMPHLTDREKDVLLEVSQGLSNQEIADTLMIGERTVRTHISNLLYKLHLTNRTQVASYAIRNGLGKEENQQAVSP